MRALPAVEIGALGDVDGSTEAGTASADARSTAAGLEWTVTGGAADAGPSHGAITRIRLSSPMASYHSLDVCRTPS